MIARTPAQDLRAELVRLGIIRPLGAFLDVAARGRSFLPLDEAGRRVRPRRSGFDPTRASFGGAR